ncbi:SDR family NAD(P)-dependent oxidoreductase [Nocardiopsis sp. N85]|uniref:SDR family NAD(P)-dependent oxidoreductase n=1 Tax=Nocardiopsis sp. N85 TaxID=3029400 RepID=UPI0031593CA1
MSENGIDGTVAVVTGAASGVGRAVALDLAAHGARIAAVDVDPTGLGNLVGALVRAPTAPCPRPPPPDTVVPEPREGTREALPGDGRHQPPAPEP